MKFLNIFFFLMRLFDSARNSAKETEKQKSTRNIEMTCTVFHGHVSVLYTNTFGKYFKYVLESYVLKNILQEDISILTVGIRRCAYSREPGVTMKII